MVRWEWWFDAGDHATYAWTHPGFKFPCADRNRGGADCRWDGTSGANPAAGALAAAEPSDFYEWMGIHTETTRTDMVRAARQGIIHVCQLF
jgi:hypothetical protein